MTSVGKCLHIMFKTIHLDWSNRATSYGEEVSHEMPKGKILSTAYGRNQIFDLLYMSCAAFGLVNQDINPIWFDVA